MELCYHFDRFGPPDDPARLFNVLDTRRAETLLGGRAWFHKRVVLGSLAVAAAVLGLTTPGAAHARAQAMLSFSGGLGTPLTLSLNAPVTYAITTAGAKNNAPTFDFQGVGNVFNSFHPADSFPLMTLLRVLLNFTHATDHVLEETAGHLVTGMYDKAVATFPQPPVPVGALQGATTDFTDAIAAQKQGGTAATAAKQVAADALISLLRQDALYVQTVVQGIADPAQAMAALLASGFEAVSNNRNQSPLAAPNINGIDNVGTGRLKLDIAPVPNARVFEAQRKDGAGDWVSAGLFQNSRGLIITGLTPGVMYTFQVRAIGGSTGQSDWSDPVSHMSL